MYEVVNYFAGPKSRWQGRIHPDEIIARVRTPWRWHARFLILNTSLDATKCGYALLHDGEVIEQFDPPIPEPKIP